MQEWMLHDALFIVPKYTKITDLICLPNSSDSIHIKSPVIPGIPSIIHYPHQILSFFQLQPVISFFAQRLSDLFRGAFVALAADLDADLRLW